jgi:hypothetical protein
MIIEGPLRGVSAGLPGIVVSSQPSQPTMSVFFFKTALFALHDCTKNGTVSNGGVNTQDSSVAGIAAKKTLVLT